MPNNPQPQPNSSYAQARAQLQQAGEAYRQNPNVENLIAVYEAQNAVRAAANDAASSTVGLGSAAQISKSVKVLSTPEAVRGERIGYAQNLLAQVQQAMQLGGKTTADNRALMDARNRLQQYIQTATAGIEADDNQFSDEYMRMTGQPPPPGRFSSAQTINGTTPTPDPTMVGGVKSFGQTAPSKAPDSGARPSLSRSAPPKRGTFDRADMGFTTDTAAGTTDHPLTGEPSTGAGALSSGVIIEGLPSYAPYDATQDYQGSGLDVQPGTPMVAVAGDSVATADRAVRQSVQYGIFQGGHYYNRGQKDALKSGRLVFTGYQSRSTKYIDDENPRFGQQIMNTKTPTYQSTVGLTYALGKGGFPGVGEYQKAMGLPVTGKLDDDTMKAWQGTIAEAAMNTAANPAPGMTIQQAIANQVARAKLIASTQRAAMAASYSVDPTASAAILGSAMKQITGRLSNPQEDSEFHRAFNSANISTQGKVDAQQFARDWVRNKYPTEAGTMAGQDYYGAMFDVLTAGPGSLGSEAANVNG